MTLPYRTDDALEHAIDQLRRAHRLPGVAWAAVPLHGPALAGASGVRRLPNAAPVTVHDRLHIGSCTKPMTATLLATLAPQLPWTTRVTDVFGTQDVHPAYHDVTLAQLLAHTSGLPAYTDDADFKRVPPRRGHPARQRGAFVRAVLERAPAGPRGAFLYSNAGYAIAAVMAERITNTPWEVLMRARVFTPLGLHSAGFGWPARVHADEPWGHRARRTPTPHNPRGRYQVPKAIAPAGDVHLSILDFATFARTHLRGLHGHAELLSAEAYATLHAPFSADVPSGLGWGRGTLMGMPASTHAGSAGTFLAFLAVVPDAAHAFVAVTNSAHPEAEAGLSATLRELLLAVGPAHAA